MNPTNTTTQSEVEEWLKPILEKEGLIKYSINVSGSSEKGDGYMGDITFVEVGGKSATGKAKTYNFVIKSGKKSENLRDMMPIRKAFENEMHFYNKVLPTYYEFQKEKGVKEPFNNAAKCYGTLMFEDIEVLILDNLKKRGFSLHNRYNPMNKEHVRKVVKTYGKLHAISFALKDQKPDIFKQLSDSLVDVLKLMSEKSPPPENVNVFKQIIELATEENDENVVDKGHLLFQKSYSFHSITDPTDPFAVIVHGDCWNNNFMFEYQDQENVSPSDVRLLDFQISRLASPAYDLSYFLFTTLSPEDIVDFDEINNTYYKSFSGFLTELGSDPKKMFPYEELLNQWKRFSLFGLVLLPSIIKICVTDKDEVPDLVQAAESGKSFASVFTSEVKETEQYRKRTLPIMRLAIERGFI